jgi:TPR repeat protein
MYARIAMCLWLVTLPLAHATDAPQVSLREEGLVAYERGHDAEAVACFRRAAEAGDARSAEMLALMYRFGPRLFAPGVSADAAESAKWAAVAAEARWREAPAAVAAR